MHDKTGRKKYQYAQGALLVVFIFSLHVFFDSRSVDAALTQNNYRWYYNADTTDPTAAVAAENTDPVIGAATSTPMHLRMNVTTTGSAIATGTQALQLQYGFVTSGGTWKDVTDPWYDGSLSHRRKITIGSTTAALTDFPLAVFLYSSSTAGNLINNIDYSRTQDSGQDIRFVTASGTPLQYQIEKWSETGTSTIWVKIPSIATSTWPTGLPRQASSTYIWMYYGNSSTSSQATTTGVWDSNYVGVMHLSETSGSHANSAINGENSTTIAVATQGSAAGKTDGADDFELSNSDEVDFADANNLDLVSGWTLSAWIRQESQAAYEGIIFKAVTDPNYNYFLDINSDEINTGFYNGGFNECETTTNLNNLAWYHVVGTFNNSGNVVRAYKDGVQQSLTAISGSCTPTNDPLANTGNLIIGEDANDNEIFDGIIDEVRISNIARSDAWIKAEFNSMSNPNFNKYGPEESYATSTAWRFANATSTPKTIDNATTTTLLLTGSDYNESYEEASTTPGFLKGLAADEDGEFDFYLDPTQATTTTTYYFRLIRATSTAALETYTNYPTITVGVPTFTQRNFQWFLNQNNVQPGTAKSPLNATTTDVDNGSLHRLRMDVSVATANLLANGQTFDLQYRAAGTGCDTSGTWINVGGATSSDIWIMYDNPGVSDAATLTTALLNSSNVLQNYNETATFISASAVNSGQAAEWDWGILNNGAAAGTTYCFRIAKTGGTALDTYTNYPKLTTSTITGGRGGGASTAEIRPPETISSGAKAQSAGTTTDPVVPSETPTTGGTGQGGGGDSALKQSILRLLANIIEGFLFLVRSLMGGQ